MNERLSRISANQEVFDAASPPYQEALRKSGYTHTLKFAPPLDVPTQTTRQKKPRSRRVTWFNPPWNSAVKTNVGKQFLRIIDTSFSASNPLRKVFNRSSVKVSYKCMPNMSSAVSSHNAKLLREDQPQQLTQGCNCQGGPDSCPLTPAQCQKDNIIYVTSITSPDGVEHYTGLSGNTFKKRWYSHKDDFRNPDKRRSTRLSSHIWKLKDEGKQFQIEWEIMDRAPTYNSINRKCRLCLKEIYYIMFRPDSASLNHRNELYNTCRHRTQNLLVNS